MPSADSEAYVRRLIDLLQHARTETGLSQQKLAALSGVDLGVISLAERHELLRTELEARRVAVGLSKSELAAISFVSYLESGKRRPTVETLAKRAWVLGTTPGEILVGCEARLLK